jgi:hypothetical protein
MKPNLTKQYPYTGDYYSYTIRTSADGVITEKVYTGVGTPVLMALSINLLGQLLIDSPTKMQLDGQIKNLVDRNGEEIYEAGEWQIVQTAPNLSALGIKEDYRYRANLTSGNR